VLVVDLELPGSLSAIGLIGRARTQAIRKAKLSGLLDPPQ